MPDTDAEDRSARHPPLMNPHRLSLYGREKDTIAFCNGCLQKIVMESYLRQPVLTLSVSEVQVLLFPRTKALFTYPFCGSAEVSREATLPLRPTRWQVNAQGHLRRQYGTVARSEPHRVGTRTWVQLGCKTAPDRGDFGVGVWVKAAESASLNVFPIYS